MHLFKIFTSEKYHNNQARVWGHSRLLEMTPVDHFNSNYSSIFLNQF